MDATSTAVAIQGMFDTIFGLITTFITHNVPLVIGFVALLGLGIFFIFWGLKKTKHAVK